MKTIYLECNMGAAGDMLMSALYEICDQKEWFLHKMNTVFAPYHIVLSPESAVSCGINGTHMKVTVDGTEEVSLDVKAGHAHHTHAESPDASFAHEASDSAEDGHSHTHTTYAAVCEEIASLDLPAEVKDDALAIYRLLGEAEAKVHDTTLEQIHFHEVGTLDALADVVGCALLIRTIAPEQILASPLHVGNGFVKCAHGVLPVPAPATARASARHSVLHRLRDRRAFNPDRCCHPALLCAALSPDAYHDRVGDRLRHRLERFRHRELCPCFSRRHRLLSRCRGGGAILLRRYHFIDLLQHRRYDRRSAGTCNGDLYGSRGTGRLYNPDPDEEKPSRHSLNLSV